MMGASGHELSDNEGTFLSLLLRAQPLSAYQVARIYEDSPVSNFGTSKGKLYPLIQRLRERGLVEAETVEGRARKVERLRCTEAGREAVREWVLRVRDPHLLLEDPLRTKIQSFGLLTRDEQIAWLLEVKAALAVKLEDVEQYGREVDVPYKEFVHDGAVSAIRSGIDWLERVLLKIVRTPTLCEG
ncbi:MAG: PadR family transcriptional regulator [Allosphingosinicella sp.]|uniref:PadR family transcriptional regulator n=1 Tax=Allosphingosinicella sp. TaxID=2823234 RepID=UPI003928640F